MKKATKLILTRRMMMSKYSVTATFEFDDNDMLNIIIINDFFFLVND